MDSIFVSSGEAVAVPAVALGIIILALLLIAPIKLLIACMVFHKTGYSWALGLLMLVPLANIIMILVLAFGDWPVRRELRRLKQMRVQTVDRL